MKDLLKKVDLDLLLIELKEELRDTTSMQKKMKLAWGEIRRAVELADSDPVIWEHYGDIARALGLTAEARKGYSRSLELGGENAEAVRAKLNELGHTR